MAPILPLGKMALSSKNRKDTSPTPYKAHDIREEEEGLLSGVADEPKNIDGSWSRRKLVITASCFIALLILGVFFRALLRRPAPTPMQSPWHYNVATVSNGTHEFKRTVIMISIDGLRADYLDRELTPHLLNISKDGLRAKSMKPIFPTLTFPNHWALMTGLYAESHGIVANNFWDPASKSEFWYNRIDSCWNSSWWFGEPMWETAGKAGLITANLMWPGPPKTTSGATASYFVPWKDHVPLGEKLDQILAWVDLPVESRPQLILAYEPSLDQAGHRAGPMSALVNQTLVVVDQFAKDLQVALHARNLTDIVDVIFVSDHGMTDTSHPIPIYMEDILGEEGMALIEHEDGWPAMGLRFRPGTNESHYLNVLLKASNESPDQFGVYTHKTMPQRFHFSHSDRIAPIYVVPKIDYILTTRKENSTGASKGSHGYDNDELAMHAMFIAHGPFSTDAKAMHQCGKGKTDKHWHSTGDAYIMERFENVEVYNLVTKLLGIEAFAAPTNGTKGFWDRYL